MWVLLLVLSMAAVGWSDPCGNATFYTYDQVIDCFLRVPFNQSVASHTLTQLAKAYRLYPFLHIAAAPPDPVHFSPPVDLLGSFAALNKTVFKSDFAFQEALKAVFLPLHDAHTAYWPPTDYRFKFIQPLNFATYLDDKGSRVYEVVDQFYPGVVQHYNDTLGLDLTQYVGAQLVQIDGQDPTEYFSTFAKQDVSTSKDWQTRFNLVFYMPDVFDAAANLGYWSVRWWRHHGMAVPTSRRHRYTLQLPGGGGTAAVAFSWLAQFADSEPSPRPVAVRNRAAAAAAASPSSSSCSVDAQLLAAGAGPVPLCNSSLGGVAFYQIDNRTMVWTQNTFEPQSLPAYYETVINALLYARFNGLDRLILDMSNNGGGDLCLGRAMLKLLYPLHPNDGPTDMPVTPLSLALSAYATQFNVPDTEWSPSFYANMNGTRFQNNDTSWLSPGIPRLRGGKLQHFSQLIQISPDEQGDELGGCGQSPFGLLQPFSPDRIVVLTRGLCGSTCALFTDVLNRYDRVRTVVLGGVDVAVPQSYRSFPGLQVMSSDDLYSVMDSLGANTSDQSCTSCVAPRRLLTSAQYRMCIREIYRDNATLNVPSEYLFQPADFHWALDRDSALNVASSVWNRVANDILDNDVAWARRRRA